MARMLASEDRRPPGDAHRRPAHDRSRGGPDGTVQLAQALGWFSIALGLAELSAPRAVARMIGVEGHESTLRVFGLREIAHGVGILSQPNPTGWVWSRVAGDVMDLAALGAALQEPHARRDKVATAMTAVLGVAALDLLCGIQLSQVGGTARASRWRRHEHQSLVIDRPRDELYRFWRDLGNLPRFMKHLEEVRVIDEKRSHWKARAPAGQVVEWDAEIIKDRPGELIGWRSLDAADVKNAGSVRFESAGSGRGTQVTVEIWYEPPGGAMGATLAKLFVEEPGMQVQEDLRRFKRLMETGEIPTTAGQPEGTRSGLLGGPSAIQALERIA